ncbi:MAG: hypothetical protein JST30_16230 [Armatimonadetes bacterium]|nr:hypothetical protein [Armatimonadota bacterium]
MGRNKVVSTGWGLAIGAAAYGIATQQIVLPIAGIVLLVCGYIWEAKEQRDRLAREEAARRDPWDVKDPYNRLEDARESSSKR